MSWNRGFSFTLSSTWRGSYCYTVHFMFFIKPLIYIIRHDIPPGPIYFASISKIRNQITWKWKQFCNVRLNRLDFSLFEHVENHTNKLFVRLLIRASSLSYRILCIHFLYIYSDTVTTVQNNIVFGVVIVQRSAHIYSCFEN